MKREFSTPQAERERLSRVHRKRYWGDPDYRLRSINRARIYQGRAPYSSADEIPVLGPRVTER